jgi:hypothetical protein
MYVQWLKVLVEARSTLEYVVIEIVRDDVCKAQGNTSKLEPNSPSFIRWYLNIAMSFMFAIDNFIFAKKRKRKRKLWTL